MSLPVILKAAQDFFFDPETDEMAIQVIFAALNEDADPIRRVSIVNYFEGVVPLYMDLGFKSHFRVSRTTMEIIATLVGPELQIDTGRPQCDINKQISITLWHLGNQETFGSLSDRFDMSKSSVREIVYRIIDILILKREQFIKCPTLEKAQKTAIYFERKNGFPGIIGCIDGCHTPITKPLQQHEGYINRKGFHSLILQGVCNEKRKFIDVECGYPGSMHDARVLRRTYLGQILLNNPETIMSNNMHLLGDSAYPLLSCLITPYRDNGNLSPMQRRFNYKLSALRIRIEHSFGILKGRFRILKHVNVYNTINIPKIILVCAVLHNLCIDANDEFEIPAPEEELHHQILDEDDRTGNLKRDYIASIL